MNKCKKIKNLFNGAYCKELDKEQNNFLENHLRECPNCRSEFDGTNVMLNFMKKRVRVEPEPAFWDNYWERLTNRMTKEEVPPLRSEKKRRNLFPTLNFNLRWVYQAAAAAVLLIIGIFIGREIFPPAARPDIRTDQQPVLASRQVPTEELLHRTRNFVERSRLMLLAIINFDSETEDSFTLNLPYQQKVSRELVQQAVSIKNELDAPGQRRLRELISDLEVILLQVANFDTEPDLSAIELIKDGVKIRGVLFKIRLIDMHQSISKQNRSEKI